MLTVSPHSLIWLIDGQLQARLTVSILTHQSRYEHVGGNNDKDFDKTDVEVWPAGYLDLIKTIKEEHTPAHVKNNDDISGKC